MGIVIENIFKFTFHEKNFPYFGTESFAFLFKDVINLESTEEFYHSFFRICIFLSENQWMNHKKL